MICRFDVGKVQTEYGELWGFVKTCDKSGYHWSKDEKIASSADGVNQLHPSTIDKGKISYNSDNLFIKLIKDSPRSQGVLE